MDSKQQLPLSERVRLEEEQFEQALKAYPWRPGSYTAQKQPQGKSAFLRMIRSGGDFDDFMRAIDIYAKQQIPDTRRFHFHNFIETGKWKTLVDRYDARQAALEKNRPEINELLARWNEVRHPHWGEVVCHEADSRYVRSALEDTDFRNHWREALDIITQNLAMPFAENGPYRNVAIDIHWFCRTEPIHTIGRIMSGVWGKLVVPVADHTRKDQDWGAIASMWDEVKVS